MIIEAIEDVSDALGRFAFDGRRGFQLKLKDTDETQALESAFKQAFDEAGVQNGYTTVEEYGKRTIVADGLSLEQLNKVKESLYEIMGEERAVELLSDNLVVADYSNVPTEFSFD